MSRVRVLSWSVSVLCVMALIGFLFVGLHRDPHALPSPMIRQPVPHFVAEDFDASIHQYSEALFVGHVSLLNVFASWCYACQGEHSFLLDIHRRYKLQLIGLDYKDRRTDVLQWFEQEGNPYDHILFDPRGDVGMQWGVYGTPETFVVDQSGVIQFKLVGPLTPDHWYHDVLPVVRRLQKRGVGA